MVGGLAPLVIPMGIQATYETNLNLEEVQEKASKVKEWKVVYDPETFQIMIYLPNSSKVQVSLSGKVNIWAKGREQLHKNTEALNSVLGSDACARPFDKAIVTKRLGVTPVYEGQSVREVRKERRGEGVIFKRYPPASVFPWRVWEVAAHMRYDPEGWNEGDADVKEARSILERYPEMVPKIARPPLDPDRYVYHWPDWVEEHPHCKMRKPLPRFFNLKTIYEAKWSEAEPAEGPSFLGAKESENEDYVKQRIGVAVRRRPDGRLRVFRVEPNLPSSEECLLFTPSTDEMLVRQAVFHLNEVLEQRRLLIPSRYSLLLKDLRLFSFRYTPPPRDHEEYLMLRDYLGTAGNYVHALAVAVWSARSGESRGSEGWLARILKKGR